MEDELLETQAQIYPSHMQILSIPNDAELRRVYDVYKPSAELLQLLGVDNRTIYSELFIENKRLGTLKDLSVAAVARFLGSSTIPLIAENPLLLQVYHDALDIDLPLENCCHIKAECFWKRVVLAKHPDKSLAIKRDINWKNLGVSLKLAEVVEKYPVEYWSEEEMKELALKVKEFIKDLHIKRLQSLRIGYFKKYFLTDSENSSTAESSYEEDDDAAVLSPNEERNTSEETNMKSESQLQLVAQLEKERQDLKEAKQKAREQRQAKRQRREAKKLAKEKVETKTSKKISYNIFDIEVSDSEDELEDRVVDKRNKSLYLRHLKKYDYPSQDCHHINLQFVQYFTNLETFILEFCGPLQGRYFHKRHHRFSLNDIKNLSLGLNHLSSLKIFRLRNSSMDAEKLMTVCHALADLPCLETVDFGFDELRDDCDSSFEQLFSSTKSLQSLELESNFLGEESLHHLGKALKHYKTAKLLYLGLARNPLTDKALHALITQIVATDHVQDLNIRGVKFITERGISCCLANELLKKHATLIKLDICALPISPLAADEIVKALVENKTILELYCTYCGLDLATEIDIKVLLQRNKYVLEHYYLGDNTVTDEEITKWHNRTRNPILLKVLAERETHKKCWQNRVQETKTQFNLETPILSRQNSLDIKTQIRIERDLPEYSSSEIQLTEETSMARFRYPAKEFGEREFLSHVHQPGPPERYYYFKAYRQKYSVKDNIKNLSII